MITAKPKPIMTSREIYANQITSLLEEHGLLEEEEGSSFKKFLLYC